MGMDYIHCWVFVFCGFCFRIRLLDEFDEVSEINHYLSFPYLTHGSLVQ
jgi:hypothetical protein